MGPLKDDALDALALLESSVSWHFCQKAEVVELPQSSGVYGWD